MFEQLRRRLTLVCTAVTSIILIGMAAGSFAVSAAQLRARDDKLFLSDLNAVFYHLASQNVIGHTWYTQTESNTGMLLYIEDGGKPLLYNDAWDDGLHASLSARAKAESMRLFGFDASKPPQMRVQPQTVIFMMNDPVLGQCRAAVSSVPIPGGWLSLSAVKPRTAEQIQLLRLGATFVVLTAAAILLLWLFARYFTARAIRPIAVNRQRQADFVSAASHELRSPLAVIQASVSAMREAPPERAAHFFDSVTNECARMSRLVDDMLTLASADSGSWSIIREETDLETLLLNTAEWHEPAAAQKQIRIHVSLPDDPLPKCYCDRQRIGQAMAILLDNAIAYTPPGGEIKLSAAKRRGGIALIVSDNGPGIPGALRERVFERFYRVDTSRSKKEHYGLGLSIAREIASLHRGKLTLRDTPGGGATFILYLPCGVQ